MSAYVRSSSVMRDVFSYADDMGIISMVASGTETISASFSVAHECVVEASYVVCESIIVRRAVIVRLRFDEETYSIV